MASRMDWDRVRREKLMRREEPKAPRHRMGAAAPNQAHYRRLAIRLAGRCEVAKTCLQQIRDGRPITKRQAKVLDSFAD